MRHVSEVDPCLTLRGALALSVAADTQMSFRYRRNYHYYSTIKVQISTDLGLTWQERWSKYSGDASTEWARAEIDLSAYAGIASVLVRFKMNGYAFQDFWYIDDIRISDCRDEDRDLYEDAACGGDDCDDMDPYVNPGAVEGPEGDSSCEDGIDNDCDGKEDAEDLGCQCRDEDGDGYFDEACGGDDCDDDPGDDPHICDTCICGESNECGYCAVCVHPGAVDMQGNQLDENCNGIPDICFLTTVAF